MAISDGADETLEALKRPGESFIGLIGRMTGGRGVADLAELLAKADGLEMKRRVLEPSDGSSRRLAETETRLS